MCRKTHEPNSDHTFLFVVWKVCLHGYASTSCLRHYYQFVSVYSMCFENLHWLKGFEMVQLNVWYEHPFHEIRTTHKRIWYYFETTIHSSTYNKIQGRWVVVLCLCVTFVRWLKVYGQWYVKALMWWHDTPHRLSKPFILLHTSYLITQSQTCQDCKQTYT